MFVYVFKILFICIFSVASCFYYENDETMRHSAMVLETRPTLIDESNKEFWENFYQNSLLSTKTKYNVINGEKVCFTCPIDRSTFTNLYQEAKQDLPADTVPAKISIAWSTQFSENRMIFFCRNNTKIKTGPIYLNNEGQNSDASQLDYSCENSRLCVHNVKLSYPDSYQCLVKSYVLNVKLNVIGKSNGHLFKRKTANSNAANVYLTKNNFLVFCFKY